MIVHIGYHKTGTTLLQNNVFPFMEGIEYIDYNTCKKIFFNFSEHGSFTTDPEAYKALNLTENQLYSFERLVGDMGKGDNNLEIASGLKQLGFKKIIISIRRQDKMVESIYRQYIQGGGTLKPKDYIEDCNLFRWSYLNYEKLIRHYVALFGLENVLVLCQEELKSNLDLSISKLKKFCNSNKINYKIQQQSNKSLSYWSIKFLRLINHFTYNKYKPSQFISKKITTWKVRYILQSKIDPYLIRKISRDKAFYAKSFQKETLAKFFKGNEKISKMFDLNLSQYGYYQESDNNT